MRTRFKFKGHWLFLGMVIALVTVSQVSAEEYTEYQKIVLDDGPEYYWTFDDGDVNALNKGRSNGGTLAAGVAAARASSTYNAGGWSLGQAATFDGQDYQSWVADSTQGSMLDIETPYESYAIEYWVNIDYYCPFRVYLINAYGDEWANADTPSVIFAFSLTGEGGTAQELYSGDGRTGDSFGPSFGAPERNAWQHVVMANRYDEGTDTYSQTCIYNGDTGNLWTASAPMRAFSAEEGLTIGSHLTLVNHKLIGMMDEVAIYDLTGLDQAAYDTKLASIAEHYSQVTVPELPPTHIPGDANDDGKVDGSDVTILAGNWQYGVTGGGATWDMGDFNEDGKVDGSDVTILAGNWQYGVTTAAAAVPEPSTLILLILLMGSGLVFCRTRSSR